MKLHNNKYSGKLTNIMKIDFVIIYVHNCMLYTEVEEWCAYVHTHAVTIL